MGGQESALERAHPDQGASNPLRERDLEAGLPRYQLSECFWRPSGCGFDIRMDDLHELFVVQT